MNWNVVWEECRRHKELSWFYFNDGQLTAEQHDVFTDTIDTSLRLHVTWPNDRDPIPTSVGKELFS